MSTYLFTWNPDKWGWDDPNENLDDDIDNYKKRGGLDARWSCGVTKKIERGDRIFLIRLGRQKPSGIMGSGFALGHSFEDGHWSGERGKKALYVDLRFDVLIHPLQEEVLERSLLEEQIPDVHWTPQSSGTGIKAEEAAHLEFLWTKHLERIGFSPIQYSEEISTGERYWEGAVSRITVNAYERNPRARSACIEHHGCICAVCNFDFERVFGEMGKGYIHVHHLKQLADIGGEYEVDPKIDLIPVCPNCHAMLHLYDPPLSCEKLKSIIGQTGP